VQTSSCKVAAGRDIVRLSQVMAEPQRSRTRERPRLRTLDLTEGERHASWLELFFDLVFVVAVAQVARILAEHTDAGGFVRYMALFVPVWWWWVGYTFYADRFESSEPSYRLLTFAGMLAVTGLSVTLGQAFTPAGDAAFVGCYVVLRAVLIALYLRAAYYIPLARAFAMQYPIGLGLSITILLVSLLTDPPLRYWLWALAFIGELLTPFINLRAARSLPIDRSHIPERFGLFTIIVLGEAVTATAIGLGGVVWTPLTILTASLGFAMAAVIWWINFDFVEDSALISPSLIQRFSFIYGHFFLVAAIVAAGVGVEHAIHEANESHLHMWTAALLAGGTAVYLASITVVRLITGVCRLVYPRVLAIAGLLAVFAAGQYLPPIAVIALTLAMLSAELWIESTYADESETEATPRLLPCVHAADIVTYQARSAVGCEECRKNNYKWVHLRLCLECGHVGCCDSSVHKHATRHYHASGHAIMASLEPGENWAWCYVDDRFVPLEQQVHAS
jgi:low temperature requirement protein LtrA